MPDAAPSRPSADRNLLFGILALQMDFITRDALIAAMHAWVLDKGKPLGAILLAQGTLQSDKRDLLEPLVAAHLEMHGGNVEKSLAAVHVSLPLREQLQSVADPDLQASLAQLSNSSEKADSWATRLTTSEQPYSAALRYHVLRPHGKGGLGEVFVAHDVELNRQVALKEIQDRHVADPQSRGRFVREAEITGGLEHPGIVPVYGLGQYADGRPYYAMRFVQGETLKDAIEGYHQVRYEIVPNFFLRMRLRAAIARQRRANRAASRPGGQSQGDNAGLTLPRSPELVLRDLLTRFVALCNAIAYAHSRGVIHRDIKPSNIMLGKFGETLVVDWGLAKAVGRVQQAAGSPQAHIAGKGENEPLLVPRTAEGVAETRMGAALGTPDYMSPEQAAGRIDQVGPATDIYSLGATLYTLLNGTRSSERNRKANAEVLSRAQQGASPLLRIAKPDVSPELDAICRKAMSPKPEQRYASAIDLAADIERWLANEPVSVYKEPWTKRFNRWRRRNKTLAKAAYVGVLVGVCSLTMLISAAFAIRAKMLQELAIAKGIIEEERLFERQAWAVVDNQAHILGEDPTWREPDLNVSQKSLLTEMRTDLDSCISSLNRRTLPQPWSIASLHTLRGYISRQLGDSAGGIESYEKALTIYEEIAARPGEETILAKINIALTLSRLGELYEDSGRFHDAETAHRKSIELQETEALLSLFVFKPMLAKTLHVFGQFCMRRDRPNEAKAAFERARRIQEDYIGTHGTEGDTLTDLGRTLCSLGDLERKTSRLEAALDYYNQSVSTLEKARATPKPPKSSKWHFSEAQSARDQVLARLKGHPK